MASHQGDHRPNTLRGGAQADTLRGMGGADVLTGGGQSDIFKFEATLAANGVDRITDYRWVTGGERDVLDLSAVLPALPAGANINNYVFFRAESGGLALYVDRDGLGRGQPEKWALLQGATPGDMIQIRVGAGVASSGSHSYSGGTNNKHQPATRDFMIDTGVIAGPLSMTAETDKGVAGDRLTSDRHPVLTFTGEPGLILQLTGPNGQQLTRGTHYTVAYANGTYTVTLKDADPSTPGDQDFGGWPDVTATSDGTYTLRATDATNSANVKTIGTFEIETRPGAVSGFDLTDATNSGNKDDSLTNDGLPVLTFQGDPGLRIVLGRNGQAPLTEGSHYRVDYVNGTYTVTLLDATPGDGSQDPFGTYENGALTSNPSTAIDGIYSVSAFDLAGNETLAGSFTIDTTAPVTPTVTTPANPSNTTTPTLTGTVPAGFAPGDVLTIEIAGKTYTVQPSQTPNPNGSRNWSLNLASATPDDRGLGPVLQDGQTYDVIATITDPAGNTASDTTTGEVKIDTGVSFEPLAMINNTDTGFGTTDRITAAGLPVLQFIGEAGLTITLAGPAGGALASAGTIPGYGGQYVVTTAPASNNQVEYTVTLRDSFVSTMPDTTQTPFGDYYNGIQTNNLQKAGDGLYTIIARDLAKNSAPVGSFMIDTTAPSFPIVTSQVTSDTLPTITGKAQVQPGGKLVVEVNNATYEVSITDDSSVRSWTLNLATATPISGTLGTFLDNMRYSVKATVTDLAGNVSNDASNNELTIDRTLVFSNFDMTQPTDTGVDGDEVTRSGNPVLTFAGEFPLQITLTGPDGSELIQNNHYNADYSNGVWTIELFDADPNTSPYDSFGGPGPSKTSDGEYIISAQDLAGNSGEIGRFTIDTTAPGTPTVDLVNTSSTTPKLTGTLAAPLEAGDTLTVAVGGATYNVSVASGTTWELDLSTNPVPVSGTLSLSSAGSPYSVTATVTDLAGNATSDATTGELVIAQPLQLLRSVYYNDYNYFTAIDPLAAGNQSMDGGLLLVYNKDVSTNTNYRDFTKITWDFDRNDAYGSSLSTLTFPNSADISGVGSNLSYALLFSLSAGKQLALENDPNFAGWGVVSDGLDVDAGVTRETDNTTLSLAQDNVMISYHWKISEVPTDLQSFISGNGNDWIIGSSYANTIAAGEGDDQIAGGGGKDRLFGGPGRDTFQFAFGSSDADAVLDFEGGSFGDKIDFTGTSDVKVANSALATQIAGMYLAPGSGQFITGMTLILDKVATTLTKASIAAQLAGWDGDMPNAVLYLAVNVQDVELGVSLDQPGVAIVRYEDFDGSTSAGISATELSIVATFENASVANSNSLDFYSFVNGQFA